METCTLIDLASDATGVIETLEVRRFFLIGHSMGGKVVQLLASRRPKGLEGIVLVAPATPTPQTIPEDARRAQLHAYDNRETVLQAIAFLTANSLDETTVEQIMEDSLRGSSVAKLGWPTGMAYEDISNQVSKDFGADLNSRR